ncbi:MAG TPA: hypothetical protein DCR24_08515 [Bacillus bacterium]|nr:hypothetical protein [Bacillus sp. (in: firmicutes)]
MRSLLIRSFKENRPVEMIYLSGNNEITHRKVIVKELNASYFKAFCFLRNDNRLFKIENILSVLPEKRKFKKIS